MIHDFNESLSFSHSNEREPWWEECYRKFFPDFVTMVSHKEDGEHQRAGIDRSVILANSKQILIDEKVRRKAYDDILLEEWSVENKKPGWVCKPLRADYIAYAIAPLGKCFLLPVTQLQLAWRNCGEAWKADPRVHGPIVARNIGYNTISWGIPEKVLFPAIGSAFRCSFEIPKETETFALT